MNSYTAAVQAAAASDEDEMEHYAYNMALAGAYLGPLHILEIVTRNAMHSRLVAHTKRKDWWDSPKVHLVNKHQDDLSSAEDKVDRQLKDTGRQRTPDDVVAALDFGFWTGLMGKGDAHRGSPYEREIWQPAVQHAFPRYHGDRGALSSRFNTVRKFRNRVTHHEPVHTSNVTSTKDEILRLISFVSAPTATWVSRRSRLPHLASLSAGSDISARVF